MPSTSTFALFLGTALLLAAMPGPGLLYIAGRTLAAGRSVGLASSLGTAFGGLVHVLAGALGVSALVMASATAFTALKLLGGLYLIYLGIRTWLAAGHPGPTREGDVTDRGALGQGFVVEATNPKTAAFFIALIPQFIDTGAGSVALQFMAFGLVSVALNTCMAIGVTYGASALRSKVVGKAHVMRRLQQASGVSLGGLGVSLLLARRPA